MDNVYRLSIYVKRGDGEPMLMFRRIYEKKSTARGVATQKKNIYNDRWRSNSQFHHATIEVYAPTGEVETI